MLCKPLSEQVSTFYLQALKNPTSDSWFAVTPAHWLEQWQEFAGEQGL